MTQYRTSMHHQPTKSRDTSNQATNYTHTHAKKKKAFNHRAPLSLSVKREKEGDSGGAAAKTLINHYSPLISQYITTVQNVFRGLSLSILFLSFCSYISLREKHTHTHNSPSNPGTYRYRYCYCLLLRVIFHSHGPCGDEHDTTRHTHTHPRFIRFSLPYHFD